MKRLTVRRAALWLIVILIAVQFIPVPMENPPVTAPLAAPDEVMHVFRRACYDCHSHETVWPWYSHVAPAAWLMAFDVNEGREELNFSLWGNIEPEKRKKLMKKILEETKEGDMPPWFYVSLHPEAQLTEQDHKIIAAWVSAETAGFSGIDKD